MKIAVDPRKSVYENISAYFEEAKKWRKKAGGVRRAMAELKEKGLAKKKVGGAAAVKKKWFEEFHWVHTTNDFLVVAGKNAKQNDLLVAKHLKEGDLFFHAEVVGAAATILKAAGRAPSEEDMRQAAQVAACYSRAWKQGWHVVDVYAAKPEQVGKYSQGEFVGKGAFLVSGERKWFRNTPLRLYIKPEGAGAVVLAHAAKPEGTEGAASIQPGDMPKEQAAKQLAKRFGVREEALMSVLPGSVEIS